MQPGRENGIDTERAECFDRTIGLKEMKCSKSRKHVCNLLMERNREYVALQSDDPISLDRKLLRVRQQVRMRRVKR